MNKMFLIISLIAGLFFSMIAQAADTPIYPTRGIYSPNKVYNQTASWSFAKPQKGYLVTISAAMRFDPAVSDYISCELPGMVGLAGNEKYRFSVSFNETKTVVFTGLAQGTNLSLVCASEGQKLKPVTLSASLIAVSVDQVAAR